VTALDRAESRLAVATRLGAGAVATDLADLGDERFDVCIDVTGAAPVIEGAFDRLARGGRLLVFGVASEAARVSLSPFRIYNDELRVLGSMAVLHSFTEAVDLIGAGSIDLDAILEGDRYSLDGYADALQAVRDGRGIKVQVDPGA